MGWPNRHGGVRTCCTTPTQSIILWRAMIRFRMLVMTTHEPHSQLFLEYEPPRETQPRLFSVLLVVALLCVGMLLVGAGMMGWREITEPVTPPKNAPAQAISPQQAN